MPCIISASVAWNHFTDRQQNKDTVMPLEINADCKQRRDSGIGQEWGIRAAENQTAFMGQKERDAEMWRQAASREEEELQALENGVRKLDSKDHDIKQSSGMRPRDHFHLWNEWNDNDSHGQRMEGSLSAGRSSPVLFSRNKPMPLFQKPDMLLRKSSPGDIPSSGMSQNQISSESVVREGEGEATNAKRSCRPKSAKYAAIKGRGRNSPPIKSDSSDSSRPPSASSNGGSQQSDGIRDTRHNRPQSAWESALTRRKTSIGDDIEDDDEDDDDEDDDDDGDSGLDEILYLDDSAQTGPALQSAPSLDLTLPSASEEDGECDSNSLSPKNSKNMVLQDISVINVNSANQAWNTRTTSYHMNTGPRRTVAYSEVNNRMTVSPESYSDDGHSLTISARCMRRRYSDDTPTKKDLTGLLQGVQKRKDSGAGAVSSEAMLQLAAGKVLDKYRKRAKSDVSTAQRLTTPEQKERSVDCQISEQESPMPRKLRPIRPKSARSERPKTRLGFKQMSPDGEDIVFAEDVPTKSKLAPMMQKASSTQGDATSGGPLKDISKRKLQPIRSLVIEAKPCEEISSEGTKMGGSLGKSPPLGSPLAVLAPIPKQWKGNSPSDSQEDEILRDFKLTKKDVHISKGHTDKGMLDFISRNNAPCMPTQMGPELDDF